METRTYKFDSIDDVETCREYFADDVVAWNKVQKTVTVLDVDDCTNYELEQANVHGWEE